LLERTLSYYCRQSIAKFDIKNRVVIYELVKQLSLIIVADLRY
jgi:DNA-binding CsgD family transcriptional regulator